MFFIAGDSGDYGGDGGNYSGDGCNDGDGCDDNVGNKVVMMVMVAECLMEKRRSSLEQRMSTMAEQVPTRGGRWLQTH